MSNKSVRQAMQQNERIANAQRIHRFIKNTPAEKHVICDRLHLTEGQFDQALAFSRRNLQHDVLANEIIAVTTSAPFLYYAASTADQANAYITHRSKIADGHLRSVQLLLEKEMDKFPEKAREIHLNITSVRRMREDMIYLLAD